MGRKFKVFLDSGANAHSCYEQIVDLEDFGLEQDWDDLSPEHQEEVMKEVAFECSEWGFSEI